jgi:protein-L-isoaspartate(D-aspartate) O-methyltransferase
MKRLSLFLAIPVLLIAALLNFSLASCSRKSLPFGEQRAAMVKEQLEQRGITSKSILDAFRTVPREEFVLPQFAEHAYDDVEAPIGFGQSLDRPYENAEMIDALQIGAGDRVLEVGTGSGYLASLISRIAKEVYTIEIEPDIANMARTHIEKLGYKNIFPKTGDGFLGWPEKAPFNAIVLTCSPDKVPKPLEEQLAEGGRLLLPLGGKEKFQELILYKKENGQFKEIRRVAPTEFVPMKGKILQQ